MNIDHAGASLIGRDKTVQALHKAMLGVEASKGTTVLVSGEAGIGKTSVIQFIESQARERGWVVMSAECLVGKGSDPYLPIIIAIQSYIGTAEKRGKDGLESASPSLPMGLMGSEFEDAVDEKCTTISQLRSERSRMFENVLDLIQEASKLSPVLFSLDDLHWAETSTLQLLYYIVQSTLSNRVLVLGTYRPEELEDPRAKHPLDEILSRFRKDSLVTVLELARFDEKDTAAMVSRLGSGHLPPALIRKIHLETGGNPFFIKEFIRELQGKPAIDASAVPIPSTVSQLIKLRIDELNKYQQSILQIGAVLGQQFNYDLLQGIAGMDDDELVNAIDGLMAHKILIERTRRETVTYAFAHSLLREVIYDGLSVARKRVLHAKVGEELEKAYKGREEQVVYKLAYHFSQTSFLAKAYKYKTMAGIVSCRHMAMEEAKTYLEDALELLQRMEPEKGFQSNEVEVLNTLGKVNNYLGNTQKALSIHLKTLDLTAEGSLERARTYRYIADVEIDFGQWKQAHETFKKSIPISEAHDDAQGLAEAFRGLTLIAVKRMEYEEAKKYAERGLLEARRARDRYTEGKLLIDIGNDHNIRDENEAALKCYEEALQVLDHHKHLDQLSRAYNNKGDIYMKLGNYERAMSCFNNCLELSRITGDPRRLAYGLANTGTCLGRMGRRDDALRDLDMAYKEFERSQDGYGLTIIHIAKGAIERDFKNFQASDELLRNAIVLCERYDFKLLFAQAVVEYGVLLKRMGKNEDALVQLDKALELCQTYEKKAETARLEPGLKELMELRKAPSQK